MADEKVNMSPEERKTPEAPAPSGPGDPPAPEHTEGPAVPGGDQAAPAHVGPATPEQSVIPGMGEDAPAPSGKVINLSDIQAADKGSKEASAPAPDKKAPEADKPPKRRGRPPKEQAGPTAEKKAKTAVFLCGGAVFGLSLLVNSVDGIADMLFNVYFAFGFTLLTAVVLPLVVTITNICKKKHVR